MRKLWMLLVACLLLGLAACGGDGGGDGGDLVSTPEAEESLKDHLATLNEAIASGNCETTVEETFAEVRDRGPDPGIGELVEPGSPAQNFECSGQASTPLGLWLLRGTELEVVDANGPAAVSEGKPKRPLEGYERWAVASLVDRDGQWRDLLYLPSAPQGEEPSKKADPGAVARQLIDAVRTGDCAKGNQIFHPDGRAVEGADGRTACKAYAAGVYLAPSVRDTPSDRIEPEELVSTRDFSIWGVRTTEAYYAVTLVTPRADPGRPPQRRFRVTDIVLLTEAQPG